jgi:hypothetical protein
LSTDIGLTADFVDAVIYSGDLYAHLGVSAAFSGVHGVTGTLAPDLALSASLAGTHGVVGDLSSDITLVASLNGTFEERVFEGDLATTIPLAAQFAGLHTASGHLLVNLGLQCDFVGAHGVTGDLALTLGVSAYFTVPPLSSARGYPVGVRDCTKRPGVRLAFSSPACPVPTVRCL